MVTGEPIPVEKQANDRVVAAPSTAPARSSSAAEKVGADTLLARIVAMVAEAQRSRAPIQRLADIVSGYFEPLVVAIAVATFIVWILIDPEPRLALAMSCRPRHKQLGRRGPRQRRGRLRPPARHRA